MSYKQLYINGTGTGTFGIYIASDTYLNAPAPDYTAHQVPGRSGDLVQWNKRLENIIRKFECFIPNQAAANYDDFKKLLYSQIGYIEITSDYDPDTYQRGYLAQEIEAEPFRTDNNLNITFELYFSCEPQKYFKNNASTIIFFNPSTAFGLTLPHILPRAHTLIQQTFQLLPPGDVPSGDAFAVFPVFNGANGATYGDAAFSMPGYSGFVAGIWGLNATYPGAAIVRAYALAGYGIGGTFSNVGADYTTNSGEYFTIILPADAVGTFTASITARGGGTTTSISVPLAAQGSDTNADAIGIAYELTIAGTSGRSSNGGAAEKWHSLYILGSLQGVPSFSGLIDIDTTPFYNAAAAGNTYPVTITIDSAKQTAAATFNGDPITIINYIGIWGELDGMADKIEIFAYQQQDWHSQQPLYFDSFQITPKWWKV